MNENSKHPLAYVQIIGGPHARGRSTGPRTAEGLARSQRARWKHGLYSPEALGEQKRVGGSVLRSLQNVSVAKYYLFPGDPQLLTIEPATSKTYLLL